MLAPLYSNIIVRLDEAKDKSEAGIILPTANQKINTGVIVEVGPGHLHPDNGTLTPLPVGPNDRIIFRDYAGQEIEVGGEKLWVMSIGDVLAVLK
ncbi:MAG TPA: co-chaperone GroES [Phycisphaerales bacterium]|jgi:chaperonin GroES|nr:co-chaperone GroES [Phycisphaerales bacterium]